MNSVHTPDERSYISEAVNCKAFLEEWTTNLKTSSTESELHYGLMNPEFDGKKYLLETMNIASDVIDELETVCSLDKLICENETPTTGKPGPDSLIPANISLETLRHQSEEKAKRKGNKTYRSHNFLNYLKYYDIYPKMVKVYQNKGTKVQEPVETPEIVLSITIYHPFRKIGDKYPGRMKSEQEMIVLGSQKLTELRDRIPCVAEVNVSGDFSDNPDLPKDIRAQALYPSGFFYINGVFYNDMRKPGCRDYSEVIIKWANENPHLELGPFKTQVMEATRFMDLELCLGYPYVYQHQGNCEHLLVVTDIRLFNGSDCSDKVQYPLVQCVPRRKRFVCMMCHIITARWVTIGNVRLPQDPFFFCEGCFRSFNYTAEGQKIGYFRAHPFFDRSALM